MTGRQRATGWRDFVLLCTICLLFNIAISSTWEPMMSLLYRSACAQHGLPDDCATKCNSTAAVNSVAHRSCSARVAGVNNIGSFALITNGVNFLTIAGLGVVSDAFGRRLALLAPIFGGIGCATVLYFCDQMTLPLFFGLTAVASFSGGQFSAYATIFAALSDMTVDLPLKERTIRFATMTVLLYVGLCIGPFAIGMAIDGGLLSVERSFAAAIIIGVLNVILVFLLAETNVAPSSTKIKFVDVNPLGGIALLSRTSTATFAVLGLNFFLIMGSVGVMTVTPIIMLEFGFSNEETALWQTSLFGSFAVGNILAVPALTKALGVSAAIQFSVAVLCFAMSSFALVFNIPALRHAWVLYLLCLPNIIGAGWDAPARALALSLVDESKYGIASAGIASLQCLLQGVTGKVTTWVYDQGKDHHIPWLVYAFCGGLNVLGFLCTLWIRDSDSVDKRSKSLPKPSSSYSINRSAKRSDAAAQPLLSN